MTRTRGQAKFLRLGLLLLQQRLYKAWTNGYPLPALGPLLVDVYLVGTSRPKVQAGKDRRAGSIPKAMRSGKQPAACFG